jgi:hypothetical protein
LRIALEEERAAVAEKFASLDKEAAKSANASGRRVSKQWSSARSATVRKRARELVATIQDRSERLKVEREAQRRLPRNEAQRAQMRVRDLRGGRKPTPIPRRRVVRDGQVVKVDKNAGQLEDEETRRGIRGCVARDRRGRQGQASNVWFNRHCGQIKDDEAEVRVKSLRFREKLENLELVESSSRSGKPQTG